MKQEQISWYAYMYIHTYIYWKGFHEWKKIIFENYTKEQDLKQKAKQRSWEMEF